MSKRVAYGTFGGAAFAVAVILAAVPPSFVPDYTFQGSSLKGWHQLGDADWRADKGQLTATPKSPAGGWLVLDQSYQDIEVSADFRCTGDCKTGVLLRAQKAGDGMKGIYVSLTNGDLASYQVTLDAQGRELSREKLGRPSGTNRFTEFRKPPAPGTAGGGTGAAGGRRSEPPARVYNPQEWNTAQIILDADVLRPLLTQNKIELAGGTFSTGPALMAEALTSDSMGDYGPIALYAGGSGSITFKDIAYKDLMRQSEPAEKVSSHFRMQRISDFYYAWCAAVADINRDGHLDIVAPPFYYLGPGFTDRREFKPGRTFNVSNEYTDDMITFAYDFTGDGWPDIVSTYTNSRPLFLYVNPKGESHRWQRYEALPRVGSEIALLRDVDGDGKPDFVYKDRQTGVMYADPDPANPVGPWRQHEVSGPMKFNPHGLGVGDINGDGRPDILDASGWWEQPAPGSGQQPWKFHAQNFGFGAGEMCVYDVNGDGLSDVVTPLAAHGWGIAWFEQKRDAAGDISFVEHPIMGDLSSRNAGNVAFSEPHSSACADLDGDGVPDLVVGKRLFSHQEAYGDPDPYGTSVLYWYRTVRNPKAPGGAEYIPELIHNRSGVGSHFAIVDLNGDGAPDIITSADRGTFIFWNRLRAVQAKAPARK